MLELTQEQMAVIIEAAQNAPVIKGYYGKSIEVEIDLRDFSILETIPKGIKIPCLSIKSYKASRGLVVSFSYFIAASESGITSRTSIMFQSYCKRLDYPGRATDKTLKANLITALTDFGSEIIAQAYRKHEDEILNLKNNPQS